MKGESYDDRGGNVALLDDHDDSSRIGIGQIFCYRHRR
jgi:hypothetical protein